jgi:hypothetical protein
MARPSLSVPEGVRRLALAPPEATEEVTWGDVNYCVRKKSYCLIAPKTLGRLVQR